MILSLTSHSVKTQCNNISLSAVVNIVLNRKYMMATEKLKKCIPTRAERYLVIVSTLRYDHVGY